MKKVCLDIDGVVLNMSEGLKIYLRKQNIDFHPENVITYNFGGDIGCSKSAVYNVFRNIDFYRNIPFIDGSVEAINRLKQKVIVQAYTTVVDVPEIYQLRSSLCKELGLVGMPYIGNKPVISDIDAIFDDCLGVHKDWIRNNSSAKQYLIDAPYNQKIKENELSFTHWNNVIRCKNLAEAVDLYLKELDDGNY